MRKYFFYTLTLLVFGFSLSSCQSAHRSGNVSVFNAQNTASQNSNKEQSAEKAEAAQGTAAEKEKTAEQKKWAVDSAPVDSSSSGGAKFENRCGWFENPTPGNVWLTDRDGEWIIGVQGGHQAEGEHPEFADDQWVKTNINYGYGCACLKVKVDYKTHRVLEIASATAKPLSACRNDPALKEPKD
ncbi:MAG: DUF4087 domain-containing protein [Acidobacteriota bacterium]|nr:DUF4087 domain-containing protein [Acidobacteriota bacterium]